MVGGGASNIDRFHVKSGLLERALPVEVYLVDRYLVVGMEETTTLILFGASSALGVIKMEVRKRHTLW